VIVHEWNDHGLVQRIGRHRRTASYRLLFHDTHHRSVTAPESMAAYDLSDYDGVLAFGGVIRDLYLERSWAARAWTWHEAADTRVFKPLSGEPLEGDLVWIGNWGDDERTAELQEFLIDPVRDLGLKARVHGVRYPESGRAALAAAGIDYAGWLPNHEAPRAFARYRVTVHVPRRPYVEALPGIPTIRPFEALACGIPLVSAPWDDAEGLFRTGRDYLVARDGEEMKRHLRALLDDRETAAELARSGRETILARHTCAHRVDELLQIDRELRAAIPVEDAAEPQRTAASVGAPTA
jgi:spore maturation protein CgeB